MTSGYVVADVCSKQPHGSRISASSADAIDAAGLGPTVAARDSRPVVVEGNYPYLMPRAVKPIPPRVDDRRT
jgi:hypothetical protein